MKTPEEIKKDNALIDESIAHWERMRDGNESGGESPDAYNCPLCQTYLDRPLSICEGCPVMLKTWQSLCDGSPWATASFAWSSRRSYPVQWRNAAQDEIDFLKSLKREVE
jgi:hypothetical protein